MTLQCAIKKRILDLMNENNLNGNQLSLLAGISRSSINKFIRNQSKTIRIESISLICEALNISLKDFFDDSVFSQIDNEN